jgi:DNA helicase-2/ATP-dependent DNA helicase PcrA
MDILEGLNPDQESAVTHGGGPLLILAGAGSGKTKALTHRVAYLIREKQTSPRRILGVTFTNKAAEEMRRRVEKLVGPPGEHIWLGTFHSICVRILRMESQWGYWPVAFTIYDEDDQQKLIKDVLNSMGRESLNVNPRAVRNEISRAKNELLTPEQFDARAGTPFEETVSLVYREYQKRLRDNGAMDFDDLLTNAVWLFDNVPELAESYSKRFLHVLVDEYQDTNRAQYLLVSKLASYHKNICVVGDDDQSIYGWRGADIRNILSFERDFPNATVIKLEQNYRSTQSILRGANDIIAHNVSRKEKVLWTERGEGEKPTVYYVGDEYQEGALIAAIISGEIASGRPPRDFAVLYRTNAQSRVLEDALRRAEIAYDVVRGVRFYSRKEVKDMIAYMRLVCNPNDRLALQRVVSSPPRGIGPKSLEALFEFADREHVSALDAMERAEELKGPNSKAKKSMIMLSRLILDHRKRMEKEDAAEITRSIIAGSGYLDYLEEQYGDESVDRSENVRELEFAAEEYMQRDPDGTLDGFLERIALVSEIDFLDGEANVVSLMTLHNAKGLEFPVVFIAGMEDGLFPHQSCFESQVELEEERRLCYVGFTRAEDKLYLLSASSRRRYDGIGRGPSRFLSELSDGNQTIGSEAGYEYLPGTPEQARRSLGEARRPGAGAADSKYYPGATVRHGTLGEGVIISSEGWGDDLRVRVRFYDGQEKTIMVRYAQLEVC